MCGVSFIDGHADGENKWRRCENCVYYDVDRIDQPCCSCIGGCNWEKSEVEGE